MLRFKDKKVSPKSVFMLRKPIFSILFVTLSCFLFAQQDPISFANRLKTNFEGSYDKIDQSYTIQGEGYSIYAKLFKKPSAQDRFLSPQMADLEPYALSQLLGGNNYSYDDAKKGYVRNYNPYEKNEVASIVKLDDQSQSLWGVRFERKMDLDPNFQRQFVEGIKNQTIDLNELLTTNDVYKIFGKPVPLTGSFKKITSKTVKDGQGNQVFIEAFSTMREAEKHKHFELSKTLERKTYIIGREKDTLIVGRTEVIADVITYQYEKYYTPKEQQEIDQHYFFVKESNGIAYSVKVEHPVSVFAPDSVNELPAFIREHIFQPKYSSNPLKYPLKYFLIHPEDTAYVRKKFRAPFWTYYDHNTSIYGVSLGMAEGGENVTTNGIKITALGYGFARVC